LSNQPILGCVLSGAGAGMIVFVNKRRKEEVHVCLLEWIRSQSHQIEVFDLRADQEGIQELPSSCEGQSAT
jgi:homoserine kinase